MAVPSYSHPEYVTINKGVWMSPQPGVPVLRQVVLDTTDVRALAEFYRRLLDLQYRPGDEHPGADAPDPRGETEPLAIEISPPCTDPDQSMCTRPRSHWAPGVGRALEHDVTGLSARER